MHMHMLSVVHSQPWLMRSSFICHVLSAVQVLQAVPQRHRGGAAAVRHRGPGLLDRRTAGTARRRTVELARGTGARGGAIRYAGRM